MRRIAVFVGGRANYSSIKAVMREIKAHPDLELQTIVGASALLERFGSAVKVIERDGFSVNWTFHNIVEGENPTTMAKSTGLGLIEIAMILDNMQPDFVVVVGDRFEIMSVALAAAYMNIPIAHTMGGEVSGTIDESIRHAVTKFAHVHFPANEDARRRIIKMGERPDMVFNFGCPRIDLVKEELDRNGSREIISDLPEHFGGVGGEIDLNGPYLLVSQHSVTTEYGRNRKHMNETLAALDRIKLPTVMLWPNIDAGSDEVSKGIRTFRENRNPAWLRVFKNLPVDVYIHLMNTTACLVGNSSSGIREGEFIGTPVVNVGTRQMHRVCGKNVQHCDYDSGEIYGSISRQLDAGKYDSEHLYGDGSAAPKIVNVLRDITVSVQKSICY